MSKVLSTCTACGAQKENEVFQSINAAENPELKARLVSGDLFTWECPQCGKTNLMRYPLLYHDPQERLMLVLSDAPLAAENLPEGYTGRQVRTPGELIEKVKIFDSGLDDIVIELCKWVSCRELNIDAEMRFLQLGGADQQMTFTYPQSGGMQLVQVGFNVYEDCRGILSRNPRLSAGTSGLATVNASWLGQFFG